ncbi:transglutaminase-like putative cysteine protease [Breoghania corrubedonensis]|uniref:Transglutaminase-like putative cysteine protease n=1 Tax=Breoghania corrubedonensis TaxID=665038 RepID=A0A2T5VCQ3_9HYPH|nr:transglutaminase family protein [Breoghania corrubedonensis]PTW61530.1 transglutaminase-like putative cysteine protease [Breoghania corrubedonensis]
MRIEISHSTHYRYDAPVAQSVQHLRLTPPSDTGQSVLDWHVETPGIEKALSYTDAFGNVVHLITQGRIGDTMTITASGVVETRDNHGVIGHLPEGMPARVYLRQNEMTRPSPAIRKLASIIERPDDVICYHALMNALRDQVAYRTGVTETHMPAAEVLAAGEGVCQDHAHIFISAARHAGVPARYVSGYLLLEEDDDASEAHHAWAEVLIEPLGWVGFDVSNGISPTDHHVRLSVGLDSRSAAPIRGVRWGGMEEALSVEVRVDRAAQQQQQ